MLNTYSFEGEATTVIPNFFMVLTVAAALLGLGHDVVAAEGVTAKVVTAKVVSARVLVLTPNKKRSVRSALSLRSGIAAEGEQREVPASVFKAKVSPHDAKVRVTPKKLGIVAVANLLAEGARYDIALTIVTNRQEYRKAGRYFRWVTFGNGRKTETIQAIVGLGPSPMPKLAVGAQGTLTFPPLVELQELNVRKKRICDARIEGRHIVIRGKSRGKCPLVLIYKIGSKTLRHEIDVRVIAEQPALTLSVSTVRSATLASEKAAGFLKLPAGRIVGVKVGDGESLATLVVTEKGLKVTGREAGEVRVLLEFEGSAGGNQRFLTTIPLQLQVTAPK